MNTCSECGQGYCESRVRRVFGHLPAGVCSATCYTKRATLAYSKRKETAMKIIDALSVEGYISDDLVTSPDRFAEIVETIEPLLKQ